MQNFITLGQPLLGEKYVAQKKGKKERKKERKKRKVSERTPLGPKVKRYNYNYWTYTLIFTMPLLQMPLQIRKVG
jgi:hypothetical protein